MRSSGHDDLCNSVAIAMSLADNKRGPIGIPDEVLRWHQFLGAGLVMSRGDRPRGSSLEKRTIDPQTTRTDDGRGRVWCVRKMRHGFQELDRPLLPWRH